MEISDKKTNLLFMVGLARSGKSTIVDEWLSCEKRMATKIDACLRYDNVYWKYDLNKTRAVVRADDIRLSLHGERFKLEHEKEVDHIKHVMIKTHIQGGSVVLVDGTHTTENSIKKLLRIDRNAIGILVPTPPEVCKARAIATNQLDLIERNVIDRMWSQLNSLLDNDLTQRKLDEKINKLREEI